MALRIGDQLIYVRKYDLVEGVQLSDSRRSNALSFGDAEAQYRETYRAARLLKAAGIYRGLLDNSYVKLETAFRSEADKRVEHVVKTVGSLYEKLDCVLVIPEISPILNAEVVSFDRWSRDHVWSADAVRTGFVISLKVPLFALDRPDLATRSAVFRELRESGIMRVDPLDETAKRTYRAVEREARRDPREKELSDRIKKGMREAEQQGARVGNPVIAEARRKASLVHDARRPSAETLSLIRKLKNEGSSLREIAKILNDRSISTPQKKRWHASSVRNYLSDLA